LAILTVLPAALGVGLASLGFGVEYVRPFALVAVCLVLGDEEAVLDDGLDIGADSLPKRLGDHRVISVYTFLAES
jgi:hypothetical protein